MVTTIKKLKTILKNSCLINLNWGRSRAFEPKYEKELLYGNREKALNGIRKEFNSLVANQPGDETYADKTWNLADMVEEAVYWAHQYQQDLFENAGNIELLRQWVRFYDAYGNACKWGACNHPHANTVIVISNRNNPWLKPKHEKEEYDADGKKIVYSRMCRACGSVSFTEDLEPGYCYVCGWLDCGLDDTGDIDEYDQENHMTLRQARENVKRGYDVDGVIKLRDIDEENSTS